MEKIYEIERALLIGLCFFNFYFSLFILFFGPKNLEKIASIGFFISLFFHILLFYFLSFIDNYSLHENIYKILITITLSYMIPLASFIVAWLYNKKIIKSMK